MKKIAYLMTIAACIMFTNSLQAQAITVNDAKVLTSQSYSIVLVSGTLTPMKGTIPGITVDLIDATGKTVRIVTNASANGNQYSFAGLVPAGVQITAPYTIKVTTNRQKSSSLSATTCSFCN